MTIGEFIRKHRERIGWSQADLARMSGFKYQTAIWKIEKDRRPLRFDEAVLLSNVLGFAVSELAALVPIPDICIVCAGSPPAGYTCNDCGRSA